MIIILIYLYLYLYLSPPPLSLSLSLSLSSVYISEGPQTGNGGGDIYVTIATILEGIVLLVTERFPAIQYLIGQFQSLLLLPS